MAGKPILTLETIEKRLYETHKNKIKIRKYNGSRKHSEFECSECGNIWNADTYSVVNDGHGCPKCSKKRGAAITKTKNMNSVEKVLNEISNNNCIFIKFINGYTGNQSKIIVKFTCGHQGETSFQTFQKLYSPKLCINCSRIKSNKNKTSGEKIVIERIQTAGFKFLEFLDDYKNGKSKIKYVCKFGHENIKQIYNFDNNSTCKECERIKMSISQIGELSWRWKDGITPIKNFLSKHLKDWKKDSMENCNYKCAITGEKFHEIHHLYSMSSIIRDSLKELNLSIKKSIGDYTQNEIFLIINKFQEIHYRYPLGVCLRKDVHQLYHKLYGQYDTIPEDFIDFVDRINSGEIQIS